jgi:hypothetical protein
VGTDVDVVNDPLQLILDRARHYIRDLHRRVQDCTPPQRALLTNCNNALRLDRPHPVVAPTTDAALRKAPAIEAPARGGNYVNAEYYPLYETADIMRALNEEGADQPISSLRELAAFCQQESNLERCYAHQDTKLERDRLLSLMTYIVLTKWESWPTRG